MAYTKSYWEATEFYKPYHLIVVGAGIVGLSAAYFYKKKNPRHRVLVVDKGFIPEGASTRNAGFACFGSVTEIMDDLKKEPEEVVKKRIKSRFDGLSLLRNVLGDQEIEYEMCGGYEIFDAHNVFDSAAENIPRFNKWLEELTWENNVYATTEINGYLAIKNRLEGALHTGKMMARLLRKVRERGVEIRWNSPIREINNHHVTIDDNLSIQADKIIVAANGFVRQLLPEIKVKPARGYVMVTNELNDLKWKGTFHYDEGFVYFRNIGDRLLLGGARNRDLESEETTTFDVNPAIKEWLIKFADETLKLEPGWKADYEWTGIMGFAETKNPVVRKINDHLYVASGLGGMGVAIGMELGRQVYYLTEEGS